MLNLLPTCAIITHNFLLTCTFLHGIDQSDDTGHIDQRYWFMGPVILVMVMWSDMTNSIGHVTNGTGHMTNGTGHI